MILEIVNPSDACTIQGDDPAVLAAATIVLGDGKYGLSGDLEMPPFILCDAEEWFCEHFHAKLIPDFLNACAEQIADALDTVTYGSEADLAELTEALSLMPEDARAGYKVKWMDRRRSSMNNIGARAAQLGKLMHRKAAEAEKEKK